MTNTWHIKRMDILYTFSSIQVSGGVKLAFGVTARKSSESLSAMPTDEIQGALFPRIVLEPTQKYNRCFQSKQICVKKTDSC